MPSDCRAKFTPDNPTLLFANNRMALCCDFFENVEVFKKRNWLPHNCHAFRTGVVYCVILDLLSIIGMKENLNTAKVTDMSYMFNGCSSLPTLDLSSFNTSRITDMSYMFNSCPELTTIFVKDWNTSKVEESKKMFLSSQPPTAWKSRCKNPASTSLRPAQRRRR